MEKYLYIFLIISFIFAKNLQSEETEDIKKLEGNLLYSYVNEDNEQVENVLQKIKSKDILTFQRDKEIIDYWYYIDDEMILNMGVAPDLLPNSRAHAFVVLGYALNNDGSLRPEAIGRCDVAYKSAIKYPNSLIFVTGGGTASQNKNVTEAGQMKDYLVNVKGLNANRIVTETKAMDTIQNAKNTVIKLIDYHIKTITVITSDYHIRRGNILFKGQIMVETEKLGIDPIIILENAVWKTGKETEGKLFEGYALASILGVKLSATQIILSLPKIFISVYNYLKQ